MQLVQKNTSQRFFRRATHVETASVAKTRPLKPTWPRELISRGNLLNCHIVNARADTFTTLRSLVAWEVGRYPWCLQNVL